LLRGRFEELSHQEARGWAWETDAENASVRLILTINGRLVQRLGANQFRGDLVRAGIGDGRHSFKIVFPEPLPRTVSHLVSVRREFDGAELPGSPKLLPAGAPFNAELKAQLAMTLQAAQGDADVQDRVAFLGEQVDALLAARMNRLTSRQARIAAKAYRRRWAEPSIELAVHEGKRHALIIDKRAPRRGSDAGSEVILSHMVALQRLGFEVAFSSLAAPSFAEAAYLEAWGITCCNEPWFATPEEALKRLGPDLDVVYIHRGSIASAYMALARHYAPHAQVLYSVADLHFLRYSRQAAYQKQPGLLERSRHLRTDELLAASRADAVLTHSSFELDLLRKEVPNAEAHLVRWSVTASDEVPDITSRDGLAFVGSFAHPPNLAASLILIDQVLPRVREQMPNVKAICAGSDMPEHLRRLSGPGVEIRGHVPDLTEIYQAVRHTVAPLPYGAGIKGKVVDSLAAGLPCVMSPAAAEGLDLPSALQNLVASSIETTAEQVIRLHRDNDYAQSSAEAGLDYIRTYFSADRLDAELRRVLRLRTDKPAEPVIKAEGT
jgi:glycosyltransferase involved in cell wall biosynthesis